MTLPLPLSLRLCSVVLPLCWLSLRLRIVSHFRYCRAQVSQARDAEPEGWNLASWSSGMREAVCVAQNMCPQCRQWCLRKKRLKDVRQVGESQVGDASSGYSREGGLVKGMMIGSRITCQMLEAGDMRPRLEWSGVCACGNDGARDPFANRRGALLTGLNVPSNVPV